MARGGFEEEAYQPAKDATCIVVSAHATLSGQAVPDSGDAAAEYLIGEGFRQNTRSTGSEKQSHVHLADLR